MRGTNAGSDRVDQLLRSIGWDGEHHRVPSELALQAALFLENAPTDLDDALAGQFRLQLELEHVTGKSARIAEAAARMEQILRGLLDTKPILCRLEGLRIADGRPPRAVCRVGGQLHELPVHPEVPLERLRDLEPWQWVGVHPQELVVVGACDDPDTYVRSHGEVAEFKGWQDPSRGLVRVARHAYDEEIVSLAPTLRDAELAPGAKLVLLHDDPRWAIGLLGADHERSRFEVDIGSIATRLEDLAGLDPIVEPLLEELQLGFLRPEIGNEFDLRPMRGMLLYSYAPGTGKTSLARALAVWLRDLGSELGFDTVLYVVKPNELKDHWHGGDARRVREDLCGRIAARANAPRTRPLHQIVVLDEVDSLGKRAGGDDGSPTLSSAQNDAVQALLAEMDGMIQPAEDDGRPPARVLWIGLTNRPDLLDSALKRSGRLGDLVLEMPRATREVAEAVLAVHARHPGLPWFVDGEVCQGIGSGELRSRFLRPALDEVFDTVVLRYSTEPTKAVDVTAGELMAGVHYAEALNGAKKRAARRRLDDLGVPAIRLEDVVESLFAQALSAARQMEADRGTLVRQLRIQGRILRVDVVPEESHAMHRFVLPTGS